MPRARRTRAAAGKQVTTLRHEEDTRTNIPTAEYQSLVREEQESPLRVAYQRRNRDLDPQLVWRGKDEQDLDDLWWSTSRPCTSRRRCTPRPSLTTCGVVVRGVMGHRLLTTGNWTWICSPTSTGYLRAPTGPSSTSTRATGRTE